MRPAILLREAAASALAARIPSALVVLVSAAMCLVAILTAGQAEASRRAIHEQLSGPDARLLSMTAEVGAEFINPATVGVLQGLDDAEAVLARTPATDVVNAALGSGSDAAPLWDVTGDLPQAVTLIGGRWPAPGEALVSERAQEVCGLETGGGAVETVDGRQIPVVGIYAPTDAFAHLDSGVLGATDGSARLSTVDVLASSLAAVAPMHSAALAVLAPPDPTMITVSSPLTAARTALELDAQLAASARQLLAIVLGAGLFLVATVVLADVMIRSRDLGRRRTLGIGRLDLVLLVSVRTALAAVPGAALAAAAGLSLGMADAMVPPRVVVAIAVLGIATAFAAAVPPAAFAARRDPVRVMRTA